ncbi:4Fe-4S cluster-binding domain-containing protein [Thermoanaerobacterium butyriciformans]|uniref:Pyruvate formate lyase activating enzyme n=1 Tax=Thermoanaerobacterium butyriciformans TaxID=1702242 RepID=A0ABS4NCR1_9THEO|nr:4Fe-4S cluster-binding domain-containing protein [Thermoanaerobacterium butyriciformans]MBP2070793.1 pyruvate formate lyase activating enzyme [Thermoanaerobacterium butyriciformans]
MSKIFILPYKGEIISEIRPAYFLKAFGKEPLPMRIFSFGKCNFNCEYCKREGQWKNKNGSILHSVQVEENILYKKIDETISSRQVIRLSGGDPCMYKRLSLKMLKYAKQKGGITSIAHNGSSVELAKTIYPYLDFASIDVKASNAAKFAELTGLTESKSEKMLNNSYKVQKILSENGVLVDVRTCVFADTTIEDLLIIGKKIQESGNITNKFWTIRLYNEIKGSNKKTLKEEDALKMLEIVKKEIPNLKIGIRTKWEPEGFIYL